MTRQLCDIASPRRWFGGLFLLALVAVTSSEPEARRLQDWHPNAAAVGQAAEKKTGENSETPREEGGGHGVKEGRGEREGRGEEVLSESEHGEKEAEGEEGEEEGEGAEEELEEEEEEEAEEEEYSEADIMVAAMLVCMSLWIMLLLRMVNWADEDMRRYTWQIISTTISIFIAVLSWTTVNMLLHKVMEMLKLSKVLRCVCQYIIFTLCTILLQIVVGAISQAPPFGPVAPPEWVNHKGQWVLDDALRTDYEKEVNKEVVRFVKKNPDKDPHPQHRSTAELDDGEVPCIFKNMLFEKIRRKMRSLATLFAHIAGFAAISAGATMQQLEVFNKSPLTASIPVVVNALYVLFVFRLAKQVRKSTKQFAAASASAGKGKRAALYDDETTEAENEISSLAFSFLMTQVIRFSLTGVLPGVTGVEEEEHAHSWSHIMALLFIGFGFVIISFVLAMNAGKESKNSEEEQEEDEEPYSAQILEIVINACCMVLAWSALFAARWAAFRAKWMEEYRCPAHSMMGRMVLAFGISVFCCGIIRGLDGIDDLYKPDGYLGKGSGAEVAQMLVKNIISSISILVGLSWEHAFDGAVEAISSKSKTLDPLWLDLILTLFIVIMIVPAWRNYIMKKSMQLNQYDKESRSLANAAQKVSKEASDENRGVHYQAVPNNG